MNLLAVDPGGSTGWARFEENRVHSFGTIVTTKEDKKPFFNWVSYVSPDILIVENYIIRPEKSGGFDHSFSTGWTLRAIGALMYRAHELNIPIVLQNANIKQAASPMAFGVAYKKRANIHHWDAVLHGTYYMMKELKKTREDLGL
jgi:hypothetical protein